MLIDSMTDTQGVMESIAIDISQNERIRHSALLFAVSAAQDQSLASALALLNRLRHVINDKELNSLVGWLEDDLQQFGYIFFY
ncbi:hypothetical protein NS2R_18845 [Pseudomonas oryzihabitans]|nr:hypothetical protein NS2R_18845 [Pseudomonas psychrotolerans]